MRAATRTWDKTNVLLIPEKEIRARVIAKYVERGNWPGAVIFTCGNAGAALRDAMQGRGIAGNYLGYQPMLVEIGAQGALSPNRWWTPEEIHLSWPNLFDATSGHLPASLMVSIAKEIRAWSFGPTFPFLNGKSIEKDGPWFVPTGSGETIVCLKMAFPNVDFCAVYDSQNPATTRDGKAPLNAIVDALFPVEHWDGKL